MSKPTFAMSKLPIGRLIEKDSNGAQLLRGLNKIGKYCQRTGVAGEKNYLKVRSIHSWSYRPGNSNLRVTASLPSESLVHTEAPCSSLLITPFRGLKPSEHGRFVSQKSDSHGSTMQTVPDQTAPAAPTCGPR